MGKHFLVKHADDETVDDKQPGCMWGLAHALNYHHWHFSNVRKMIHYRRYENHCDWSPNSKMYPNDVNEVDKLLVDQSAKKSTKKRSLRARIKALIAEEESENIKSKKLSSKSRLERTYSIHHLESLDAELAKIPTDWNHPIIFLPKNVENHTNADSIEDPDVLDIFKVDKEVLKKHLSCADESVANFTRSALGLNTKSAISKSRSFPVADWSQGRTLKPIKLESKQNEVWSFPKEDKFQALGEKLDEYSIRKSFHRRSSSSHGSLDKYARLFEKSFQIDVKLRPSKSLKLANEFGHAPISFRRVRSLSTEDSCYSNLKFDLFGDDRFGNGSLVAAKDSSSGLENKEDQEIEILDDKESGLIDTEKFERESLCSEISHKELREESLILDSDICLEETEFQAVEVQISEDSEHKSSSFGELCCSTDSNDHKSLQIKSLSTYSNTLNLKNAETSEEIIKCCPEDDLYYVRHILDQSGIAVDAFERTWHEVDQPLSPQLFEEVESLWPHDQDQSIERTEEFYGCWHHQMLFDLVNEVLLDVYDRSLPYYPKKLSSSCHIPPFPVGNFIVDDVTKTIRTLMSFNVEEKPSLDCIVARDMDDDRWMNLQVESEFIGLELEEMIFDELLEEVICSSTF